MTPIPVATLDGGIRELDASVLEEVRLRGKVLRPGDQGYDGARTIWNAMIDRCPGLIVRCAGAADVLAAVRLAREHGLLVSVRSGGHGVAGDAVTDGGLMIDLSPMKAVRIDPARRRAQVQPGAKLRDFDHEAQAFALATPLGVIADTGVAGLTLGGGFGLLSRKHGLAIDNLLSVDVVTADGELRHASERENPDLFWALRGGGGNFGIVTNFEFALHPVGPLVLAGLVAYPLEQAGQVLRNLAELAPDMPDELSVQQTILGFPVPPLPFLPEEAHGTKAVGLLVFWAGDADEGREAVKPVLEFGEPIGHQLAPMPYTELQQLGDPFMTPPARNYWKSQFLDELADGAIDALVTYAEQAPSQQSQIIVHQLGGQVARVAPDATAFPHRGASFEVNVQARWHDPEDDERTIGWARAAHEALNPYATGSYVNADPEAASDTVASAYGSNAGRLEQLKHRYDPGNLFRLNANLRPRP